MFINMPTRLKDNAMLKVRPDLIDEWDFEKNYDLGLNIYTLTKGMSKKVWWICPKCRSSYDMRIDHRISGSNCSYCSSFKVNHTNSLAELSPEVSKEWDFKMNKLTPNDYTVKSNKKVWWKCSVCEGSYNCQIASRKNGGGCPYCSSRKILIGFNDMWTTNPKLASLLLNKEDGHKFTQKSNKRANWKCPDCSSILKNKQINTVARYGLCCPNCSDGVSFPEKFLYHILKENGIQFDFQKSFRWAKNKKYDFYIEEYNCIVEVHGGQHTTGSFRGRKRDEESNDKEKRKLAKKNGIEHYIEVDAFESTGKYISNSIMSLDTTIKNILISDFKLAEEKARGSFMKKVWDMWNSGLLINDISKETGLSRRTVGWYLKIGARLDKCDYTPENARTRSKGVKIIQLDKDMNFIREWDTIKDAVNYFQSIGVKSPRSSISGCCRGTYKTSQGYKWLYADEYYKMN